MPGQGWTASWSTLKSQQAKYYALQACHTQHCPARDVSHSAHPFPEAAPSSGQHLSSSSPGIPHASYLVTPIRAVI